MIRGTRGPRLATALVAALLAAGCGGDGAAPDERRGAATLGGLPVDATLVLEPPGGEPVEVSVAVADSEEERAKGLMNVSSMPDDEGMVFLHEEPVSSGFWMKNTLIPLSLALWDEQGEILAILDMEPCEEDPCTVYDPGVTWIGAVEVNQGFFEEHGIEVGATATLER